MYHPGHHCGNRHQSPRDAVSLAPGDLCGLLSWNSPSSTSTPTCDSHQQLYQSATPLHVFQPPAPPSRPCPFCAPPTHIHPQVWLALEEKGLSYDCIPIELYNKPPWYEELVPTTLVSGW